MTNEINTSELLEFHMRTLEKVCESATEDGIEINPADLADYLAIYGVVFIPDPSNISKLAYARWLV